MGYDAHALVDGVPLVARRGRLRPSAGGSPGISDGDVIAPRVDRRGCSGAAGLGDIGGLFPSGEERFRGVSSLSLLEEAYGARSSARGWRLVNADCVLVGEEPRIAAHRDEMRRRLGAAIGEGEVNVRATTDRPARFSQAAARGLAAHAVALLERR